MRHAEMNGSDAQLGSAGSHCTRDLEGGLAVIVGENLGVEPGPRVRGAQRFRRRLLRGEWGGLRGHRTLSFRDGENPSNQSGPALDRFGEPVDVTDVDTDSNHHALFWDASRASPLPSAVVVVAPTRSR